VAGGAVAGGGVVWTGCGTPLEPLELHAASASEHMVNAAAPKAAKEFRSRTAVRTIG